MQKVSCIICAYNEEGRLGEVLDVASRYPRFSEVIVIDDGSSDNTYAEACSYEGVRVLRHKVNKGKAAAFEYGYRESSGDLICMLDADLYGLNFTALDRLIMPALACKDVMSLSLRRNALPVNSIPRMDLWTGERVFPSYILEDFDFSSVKGYGIETAINICALKAKLDIYSIQWPKVGYTPKRLKHGVIGGWYRDCKMVGSIMVQYGPDRVVSQYVRFWAKRKYDRARKRPKLRLVARR